MKNKKAKKLFLEMFWLAIFFFVFFPTRRILALNMTSCSSVDSVAPGGAVTISVSGSGGYVGCWITNDPSGWSWYYPADGGFYPSIAYTFNIYSTTTFMTECFDWADYDVKLLYTTVNVLTDNGCAASTCYPNACWNNLAWVTGARYCDNGCAASTCYPNSCWNSYQWVTGSKLCDNGCASSVCQTSNTGMATTCWNSYAWVSGTKLPSFTNQCSYTNVSCTSADCGNIIPTKTVSCISVDSTGCMNQTSCSSSLCSIPDPKTQQCSGCQKKIQDAGGWKEITP